MKNRIEFATSRDFDAMYMKYHTDLCRSPMEPINVYEKSNRMQHFAVID